MSDISPHIEELRLPFNGSASSVQHSDLPSGTKSAAFQSDAVLKTISTCTKLPPREAFKHLEKGLRAAGIKNEHLFNSMAPLLPIMLTLRGEPYTLRNHFMMEPVFKTVRPWELILKCGRQVSKSTTLAAQSILQTSVIPYFNTLFILPLYEMTRRFSNNYVRTLIEESPVKACFMDSACENNVLQRSFINKSLMFFSYAFRDCERVRGISASNLVFDEVQDLDWDFLPVIGETISASEWGLKQYSGTPKSFDNTIQVLWEDSSQAEWCVRCGCGHWNIPSGEFDIHGMIGPVENIAKYGTGVICSKCGAPLDIRAGGWVHQYRDRFTLFSGYHVPQVILPHHYADEKNWMTLIKKRDSGDSAKYLNECLGESCDVGLKLITLDELKSSCCLGKNDWHEARRVDVLKKYVQVIMGVDWGGGGEEEVSFTTIAVIGMTADGRYEAIFLERLHIATSDVEEVKRIIQVFNAFKCKFLAHDYAGAGSVHETLLLQAGFPAAKIIPFNYMHVTAKPMIYPHNANNDARYYYILDKARSVLLLATLLKTGFLKLPEYESCKDLVNDFLHINKETQDTFHRGSMLLIKRTPKMSDDVVHAINFACCAIYHITQKYPEVASAFGISVTEEQLDDIDPDGDVDYEY